MSETARQRNESTRRVAQRVAVARFVDTELLDAGAGDLGIDAVVCADKAEFVSPIEGR